MEPIAIAVDPSVYALDVVQRAAFRCSDMGSFEFAVIADRGRHNVFFAHFEAATSVWKGRLQDPQSPNPPPIWPDGTHNHL